MFFRDVCVWVSGWEILTPSRGWFITRTEFRESFHQGWEQGRWEGKKRARILTRYIPTCVVLDDAVNSISNYRLRDSFGESRTWPPFFNPFFSLPVSLSLRSVRDTLRKVYQSKDASKLNFEGGVGCLVPVLLISCGFIFLEYCKISLKTSLFLNQKDEWIFHPKLYGF